MTNTRRFPWFRRMSCRLFGHDMASFSGPVTIPWMPQVTRLVKRVCDRCGYTEYGVNRWI